MSYPKVTIIWLNYNSMKFIDLALNSLESLFDVDYPNYEVIIVDNGSSDGSFDIIRKYIERKDKGLKIKVVRLSKNKGYCGGNNVGFRARSKDSKYVVVLNNDAIVFSDSLRYLVEEIESDPSLGAVQGIIVEYNSNRIDTAGGMLDEILNQYRFFAGLSPQSLKRPVYVTYAEGAFSLYKVDAVLRANKAEKLFEDILFAYSDDVLLGLRLWNSGYKIKTIPVIVARHKRSSSFGKIARVSPLRLYLMLRNKLFLISVTNSRYKRLAYVLNLLRYFMIAYIQSIRTRDNVGYNHAFIRAIKDFRSIVKRYKLPRLDLYKAPLFSFPFARDNREISNYLKFMQMNYIKTLLVKY